MRGLTRWLVEQYTDFGNLEGYFDGYSIFGERLSRLTIPASLLTSADDPIIPVDDFLALRLPDSASLEIARHGGHCGFLDNLHCDGFAERWVAEQLDAAVSRHAGTQQSGFRPGLAASVAPSSPIPG
jgi:predicted alpha/beta-fold hydrolase